LARDQLVTDHQASLKRLRVDLELAPRGHNRVVSLDRGGRKPGIGPARNHGAVRGDHARWRERSRADARDLPVDGADHGKRCRDLHAANVPDTFQLRERDASEQARVVVRSHKAFAIFERGDG